MPPTADSNFGPIAVLVLVVAVVVAAILVITHLVGPKRHGAVKESPYESGVDPVGDTRKRFNVRFYLVAVLFLIFDVEIIFLYPWATIFPRLTGDSPADLAVSQSLAAAGYGLPFFIVAISIFFVLLFVGFVYEWRKGIFQWD